MDIPTLYQLQNCPWPLSIYGGPTLSNNASLNADMSLRPNVIGDPMTGITQSREQWFNPAAYAVPAQFTFGNAGRSSLRGPDVFEADFSFAKDFALTERLNMQFRAEMYNIFNRTNLALPSTDVDTGTAGLITDIASPMRNMQFGMRFSW